MNRVEFLPKLLDTTALLLTAEHDLEPAFELIRQHNNRGEDLSEEDAAHVEVLLENALVSIHDALDRLRHIASHGTKLEAQHPWPGGWPEKDPLGDYKEEA